MIKKGSDIQELSQACGVPGLPALPVPNETDINQFQCEIAECRDSSWACWACSSAHRFRGPCASDFSDEAKENNESYWDHGLGVVAKILSVITVLPLILECDLLFPVSRSIIIMIYINNQ